MSACPVSSVGPAPPHSPAPGRLSPSLSLVSSSGLRGTLSLPCLQALSLNSLSECRGKDKSEAPAPPNGVSGEWPLRGRKGYPPLLPEQRGGQASAALLGAPPRSADARAETAFQRRARGHRHDQSQSRFSLDHNRLHAALFSLSLSLSLRPPHPPTHTLGLASRPQHPLLTSAPGVPGLPGAPGFPGSPGGPWQGGGEEGGENGAKLSLIGCSVVCRPHWMEGRKEVESQSADVLTGGPGGPFGPRSPWKARGKAGQWVSGGCWGPSGTGTGQVVRSCDQPPGATGRRTASLRSPQASRPHSQPSSTSHPASG